MLRGSFNAAIFQPAWFEANGLVRPEQAENADIALIHRDASAFEIARVSVQVTPNTFEARVDDVSAYEVLRDLVAGTFDILKHTPIRTVGLNHDYHFAISAPYRTRVMQRVAPSEAWRVLSDPSLRILAIRGGRPDRRQGAVNVQLEPSVQIDPGLYVGVNDHYQLTESQRPVSAGDTSVIIRECWTSSRETADQIAEHITSAE